MKKRLWSKKMIKLNRLYSKIVRSKNAGYMDRYKAYRTISDNMRKALVTISKIDTHKSAAITHGMLVMRKKRIICADKLAYMLAYK